ncbi:Rieske (2Fe-2S) protein [Nocardioides gilvus]|uniref:Rieske (2Fe-2S) protein n=1 Tax=Nocardioides gilvus TaxID=1735589 RepID=UPI000D750635|nr:Rieske (2Fe-2S) protein [Nocardioides gilvus]
MSVPLSRRGALATGSGIVAAPLLAGCGNEPDVTVEAPQVATGSQLASTADIPVGGCAVFPDSKTVVTQPSEGKFRAFSAACTHEGCQVSSSSDGEIPCQCHGSAFSLEDGSVLKGPATEPLPEVEITVEDDKIMAV